MLKGVSRDVGGLPCIGLYGSGNRRVLNEELIQFTAVRFADADRLGSG
jgi:hypothetical protein